MKQGCLVTGSLEPAIKMVYNLELDCGDDN